MKKNVRLADIYVRIYNKRPLTFDDLVFLSKYDRECFEKTYRNVMYNLAEAKEKHNVSETMPNPAPENDRNEEKKEDHAKANQESRPDIQQLLDNIKNMQWEDFPVPMLQADNVKQLLGSLYMEKLFPHNDKYRYFQLEDNVDTSTFNKKA